MKARQILPRLIVVAVGVLVTSILIEIALRIWTPGSLQYKAVRRADPVFHHSLVPSAHYVHHSRDFTMDVRTNSLGFRDREHTNDPVDAYRTVILGDSFVEGYGVPMESCFVHRLESKLNDNNIHSRPIAVYNMGVAGYSPIIEYLVLKQQSLPLRPELVILFYDMNDVQEDFLYAEDAVFDSVGVPVRVNPSWPSFGHVTLIPRGFLKTYLREKSYLYTIIADAINRLKPKPLYEEGNILAGQYMHTVDSTSVHWEKYFRGSQFYIELMADLCRKRNIHFVLVTYPRGNQVNTLEWVDGRRYWGLDSLVHNSAIFGSLQTFAGKHSIPFLNMTPVFRARSRGDMYYPYDGHWTSAGHSVAADTLYHFLIDTHLIPN